MTIYIYRHQTKRIWSWAVFFLMIFSIQSKGYPGQYVSTPIDELKQVLVSLEDYQQGKNDDLVLRLNDLLRKQRLTPEYRDACEVELVAFLNSKATPAAKMEVCRHLRVFGSADSVPVLKKMLTDEKTADPARYALEKIPGAEADKALMDSLEIGQKNIQLGIVSSLGKRKVEEAVPYLRKMLAGSDEELAFVSAVALGDIGSQDAVEVLSSALYEIKGILQTKIAESLLICAERALSSNRSETAGEIYGDLFNNSDLIESIRGAALSGKIRSAGISGRSIIWNILQGKDKALFIYAIKMIPECYDDESVQPFCALIPQLPAPFNVHLITVLVGFRSPAVLDAVTSSLKSNDRSVRMAALQTLEKIGNSSTVVLLVRFAAETRGEERDAARTCLWNLSGKDIDKAVMNEWNKDIPPELQAELILCIGERRISEGRMSLMDLAASPEEENRLLAMKTLSAVSQVSDLSRLIDILIAAEDDRGRDEMIMTVALVARKIRQSSRQANIIVNRLSQVENPETRALLYRVLGKIGDDTTLPLLRQDKFHEDPVLRKAVVYALADWPDSTPRDDLFQIASRTEDKNQHVLSLQAYIRMIEKDKYRMPEAAVNDLGEAVKIAQRKEEKIAVLGLLPQFACPEALALAELLSQDDALKAEAEMAVVKIKNVLER